MNWLTLSVAAGIISSGGAIICKGLGTRLPPYIMLAVMGLTFATGSTFQAIFMKEKIWKLDQGAIAAVVVAGMFFWLENIGRYTALQTAPITAYVWVTIPVVTAMITTVYDLITLSRAGKLGAVNLCEVGGITLTLGALVLFALAPKR